MHGMFLQLIITIYNDNKNIINNPNLPIYDYWKVAGKRKSCKIIPIARIVVN